MVIAILVIVGLCFGSFVNALVWRVHEQEGLLENSEADTKKARKRLRELSMLRGRSMCSKCGHSLAAKDLIPVFSWMWLRGKCRYCGKKIADNPAVEVAVPALFVFSYVVWPNGWHGWGLMQFCFWLVFVVGFVALAVYDLRWYILPDRIVWPLAALAAVEVLAHALIFGGGWRSLLTAAAGVLIASGFFFVLFQVSDGKWIGGGDVKLGIVLGLLLGGPLPSLLVLFFASMLGTFVSIPLLIAGKAKRNTLIPFGPFLLTAACIVELFGMSMVQWANRLLG